MSDITDEIRSKLAQKYERDFDKNLAEATARQKEIAKHNQNRRSMDGVGRATMEVDTKVYNEWVQREGKEIWKDKDFRKWIGDRNPELRVKSGGTGRTQVGYGS